MLCEHCGKTFQREGNFRRHKCKKNISKLFEEECQLVVEPENHVHSSSSSREDEEECQLVVEPENHVHSSSREDEEECQLVVEPENHVHSSSREEKNPKAKRVTFKDNTSSTTNLNDRLSSIDKLNDRLSSIDKLNDRLSSIEDRISSLEACLKTRVSTSSIVDELSKVKTELTNLFNNSKTPEHKTPEKQVEEVPSFTSDCCLIMATSEDRLKRKLFKICLVENWSEQQDKVKDTYHVIMEKMCEKAEGYTVLAEIEREFSKKRVSANKKWYKLRDDDIEGVIDLFN